MPATFPRSRRLQHDREYQAVYGARMKKVRGPLALFTRPNARAFHRLGLSIGKRVGGATERNRVKRMIREAFRLSQHVLPTLEDALGQGKGGLDLVVSAQAHEGLTLAQYQSLLAELVALARKDWIRRVRHESRADPGADATP